MSGHEHEPQRKRRRVDVDAATTLSKPFKSPMRTRVASSVPLSTPDAIRSPKYEPSPAPIVTSNSDSDQFTSSPSLTIPPRLVVSTRSQYSDPELLDLQKKYRTLCSQRTTQEKILEAARQALRIESSGNDTDLEALIIKWRRISQEAAEEVFAGARERVARMGGMKAWRERSEQDATRWESENRDRDQAYMYDEDMEDHPDTPDHLLEKNSSKQDGDTPEEFTTEFMLKTLNIEHKTIGFDAVMGKWIRE